MRRIFVAPVAAAAAVSISVAAAQAAGFASRDQSTVGEGMSFAGEGTPGMGLSAMFWNPAAVTQTKGWGAEAHVTFTFPNSTATTNPAQTTLSLLTLENCTPGCPPTGNMLSNQTFPAFYGAYRINPDWYLGLSITRPFGFSSNLNPTSITAIGVGSGLSAAEEQIGTNLKFDTIDVNPVVGWRINDQFSVGIGPQFVWLRNTFTRDLFQFPAFMNFQSPATVHTDGFGVGLTAGLTYTPSPATEVAVGYRSQVQLNLNGQISFVPNAVLLAAPPTAPFSGYSTNANAKMTLPDQVNIGLRQRATDKLTLLGTVEWTHWSVLQSISYNFASPNNLIVPMNAFFTYRDSWFVSAGGEYKLFPDTTLRGGVGYETSPVNGTMGAVGPLVPGGNTTSLSAGLSHKFTERLTFDLAYAHMWMDTQQIVVGAGNPSQQNFVTLIPGILNSWAGSTSGHSDAVSFAIRYAFSEPPVLPLLTKAK